MEQMNGLRNQKKEEKRKRMLEVATAEFASKAYSDVSTDVIVEKCGISKGLLFNYFSSKKNLYLSCLEQALQLTTYAPVKPVDLEQVKGEEAFFALLCSQFEADFELGRMHVNEKLMIEMAQKEEALEIKEEKKALMARFLQLKEILVARKIGDAMEHLDLHRLDSDEKRRYFKEGLKLYILSVRDTLMKENRFENSQKFEEEFRGYINIMLWNIK